MSTHSIRAVGKMKGRGLRKRSKNFSFEETDSSTDLRSMAEAVREYAACDDIQRLKAVLRKAEEINGQIKMIIDDADEDGWTSLFHSARWGTKDITEFLIHAGADVYKRNHWGNTPLFHACRWGHGLTVGKALILAGAKLNERNELLECPLDACEDQNQRLELLKLAIEMADGGIQASISGESELLRQSLAYGTQQHAMLSIEKDTVFAHDGKYETNYEFFGLVAKKKWSCCNCNKHDAIGCRINFTDEKHNDVNYRFPLSGKTLLQFALQAKTWNIVDSLLQQNADVGITDEKGIAPNILILQEAPEEVVKTLIEVDLPFDHNGEPRDHKNTWFEFMDSSGHFNDNRMAFKRWEIAHWVIKKYPHLARQLADIKDKNDREIFNITDAATRSIFNVAFLWHGRYRLVSTEPDHISHTCYVFKAFDEAKPGADGKPMLVAVKLMRVWGQFLKELQSRKDTFDPQFIVPILDTFPSRQELLASAEGDIDGEQDRPDIDALEEDEFDGGDGRETGGRESEITGEQGRRLADGLAVNFGVSAAEEHKAAGIVSRGTATNEKKAGLPNGTAGGGGGRGSGDGEIDESQQEENQETVQRGHDEEGLEQQQKKGLKKVGTMVERNGERRMQRSRRHVERMSKEEAEAFYCIVMPLGERNLFVAIKQESFAGKNMAEVKHIFNQIVKCVEHLHAKGVLHGDIKPLNILRSGSQWKLIDLDSSCRIGQDTVGDKYSSAYLPPEAVYSDPHMDIVAVRSHTHKAASGLEYEALVAHASFDVWALGCVLYQLCTACLLFKEVGNDNISDDAEEEDSLWELHEWSDEYKCRKLHSVKDPLARNLLHQILTKNVAKRPSISRIMAHPFLSAAKATRMVGESASFDVFLSYRVASDSAHVKRLYDMLTARGLRVWLDSKCLEPGVPWKEGFCAGLIASRTFVCLLSRGAINDPEAAHRNFSRLTEASECDNVFLEHRLALELRELGLIEKIFPVLIGDYDKAANQFGNPFAGCLPYDTACPDICVEKVEADLRAHMASQGLGSPTDPTGTVKKVYKAIMSCQGGKLEGSEADAFSAVVDSIQAMLRNSSDTAAAATDAAAANASVDARPGLRKLPSFQRKLSARKLSVRSMAQR